MIAPPKAFKKVAKKYIPLRITNMDGVDLNMFRFDYDLTFSVLLMNADGTVYHRFGGRDHKDPMSYASIAVLTKLMEDTLGDHETYSKKPNPPKQNPLTVKDLSAYAAEYKDIMGRKNKCIHCHMVNEALRKQGMADGTWNKDSKWLFPEPSKIGLTLDAKDQNEIAKVEKASAAAEAGLKKGHVLVSLNGQHIRTFNDVQWALNSVPPEGGEITAVYRAKKEEKTVKLTLTEGWKASTPLEYSWRSLKWPMRPGPGFGGKKLESHELKKLKIKSKFAFKVTYLVTWGKNAHVGRNAAKAGIRRGDIVYSIAGKSDFESLNHYHAWFRFTQKVGTTVEVLLIRNGKKHVVQLPVVK